MTIPAAAIAHDLYKYGYLVFETYSGIEANNPAFDNRAKIQEALNDARNAGLVLWFETKNAIWYVSDFLEMYFFRQFGASFPQVQFQVRGRPNGPATIKLMPSATGFSNAASPRPLIVWRYYEAQNESAQLTDRPSNPYTGTMPNWNSIPPSAFHFCISHLNLDVSGFAGAVGIIAHSAQNSQLNKMKITATNAYSCIRGLPLAQGLVHDVECIGGRYAIDTSGGVAGANIVGFKASGQTVAVFNQIGGYVGDTIVGFDIQVNNIPVCINSGFKFGTSSGTIIFVDGIVRNISGSQVLWQKDVGSSAQMGPLYIENVYITGTDNIIQTNNDPVKTYSGTWKRIKRYSYNPIYNVAPPYTVGSHFFRSYMVLDGAASFSQKEYVDIQSNSTSPDIDFYDFHRNLVTKWYDPDDDSLWSRLEHPGGTSDMSSTINAGLSSKDFVLLGKGNWYVSSPTVVGATKQILGVHSYYSVHRPHQTSFSPSTGYTMDTEDSQDSVTSISNVRLEYTISGVDAVNMGNIRWRGGVNSRSHNMCPNGSVFSTYVPQTPRYNIKFEGNGGGKHYGSFGNISYSTSNNNNSRGVLAENTEQPTYFYGFNIMHTKLTNGQPGPACRYAVEYINCKNIRMYGWVKEGSSAAAHIVDGDNICIYGIGRFGQGSFATGSSLNMIHVEGTSNNIMAVSCGTDTMWQNISLNSLNEDIVGGTPLTIAWPNFINLYLRGSPSLLQISSDPPPDPGPSGGFIPGKVEETNNIVQLDFNNNEYSETEFSLQINTSPPEAPESTLHVSQNGRYFVEDF